MAPLAASAAAANSERPTAINARFMDSTPRKKVPAV
jgi:hypothetical protein